MSFTTFLIWLFLLFTPVVAFRVTRIWFELNWWFLIPVYIGWFAFWLWFTLKSIH